MRYPINILPNANYKNIDCDLSDHYLIRHIPANNLGDLIEPSSGLIKQKIVFTPSDQAHDLSTSLLGVFEIEHLKIELTSTGKSKYNKYCEPDCTVSTPVFKKDYHIKSDRHFWSLLISKINNNKANYEKSKLPLTAECKVQHSPMKWNYWHFSIRWQTQDGLWHELPDNEKRKRWSRRLAHEVRSLIAMFAKIEEPNYFELEKSCYMKSV